MKASLFSFISLKKEIVYDMFVRHARIRAGRDARGSRFEQQQAARQQHTGDTSLISGELWVFQTYPLN
jgi:hypothetical protein